MEQHGVRTVTLACPSCGVENEDAAENCFRCGKGLFALTEGSLISSRYEIQRFLGKGGMGMVYKAHDRELDEVVAVKVLRSNVADSSDLARRFRSEIKLARKVRHPNVCAIHEYGQHGHLRYIVMEYIEGVDLKQVLKQRGALPVDEAYEVASQVATGLQAIHDVGIVHRDLKTPNIMRDSRGLIRLMDFGIAKRFDTEGTPSPTATGHVVGTPEYMSPEQARGEKIDARTDIYALGIVVFELFTGEVPFRGDTPLATIFKHLQDPPPLEGPRAAKLPAPAVPILRKALAKAPEDRFASAAKMADALRAARARSFPAATVGRRPSLILSAAVSEAEGIPETVAAATPVPTSVPTAVPTATMGTGAPLGHPSAIRIQAPERSRLQSQPARAWWTPAGVGLLLGALAVVFALAVYLPRWAGSPAADPAPAVEEVPSAVTVPPTVTTIDAPAVSIAPASPSIVTAPRTSSPSPPARPPQAIAPSDGPRPTSKSAEASEPTSVGSSTAPAASSAGDRQPSVETTGTLRIVVLPWADISIDGRAVGHTPLKPLSLGPGDHIVRIENPGYHVLQRKVTIRPGQTTILQLDLAQEAFPK